MDDLDEKTDKEIFEELQFRSKTQKYRNYEPIGKMEEYLDKLGSGDYIVSAILAANGIGKTTAMVNFLAHLIWPCGNEYFQQPLLKDWPYPKTIRIASDPETLKSTIIPMIHEWFPIGRYTETKAGKTYMSRFTTDNGWSITCMSYEQDSKEFESSTLGLILCDEPPPEPIHKANVARLRKGGVIGIFATPLIGSAWLYDEIVAYKDKEKDFRTYVTAEVEDACIDHGIRGFLKHDDIVKMVSQYKPEDMQARVFGKFQHLTGLIFKDFTPDIHVIKPFELNRNDYVVYQSWDTHPRENEAIIWVAVDRKGTKYVVDELWSDAPTEELVARIKTIDAKYRIVSRVLDPLGFIEDKRTNLSFAKLLSAKFGLVYQPASKRRMDGVGMIQNALSYQLKGSDMIRPPGIYYMNHCSRTIWETQHWQWQEYAGKSQERHDKSGKPQDKDDHFMEALGRVFLDNAQFQERQRSIIERSIDDTSIIVDDDPFN